MSFINENQINQILKKTSQPQKQRVEEVLNKALTLKGLELEEVSVLLNIYDNASLNRLFNTALKIKEEIYGKRLVLFAPVYVSNYCSNNCLYCGFRKDNKEMKRRCLTLEELKEETKFILEQGHKRILMLMGEHTQKCGFEYFLKGLRAAYSVSDSKENTIRRINIEIQPLTEEQFQKLSKEKIGTYTVFQETYHKATYKKMHPIGKKADYEWRLNTMDRALNNGLHDIGIGALFGLYNYKFEVMALIQHAQHLDKTFNIGPHTISIPRLEHAQNAPVAITPPCKVSDNDFKKLVAVLRCAVPYTGIILSTRESAQIRKEVLNLGVSQISAGSKTNPGGYKEASANSENEEQFSLSDTRSSGEVIKSVLKQGFIPSFCTGCYRRGRVGRDFMDLAKPGLIKQHCLPNALTTLKEYLEDYADEETKKIGTELIKRKLNEISDKDVKQKTTMYLNQIEKGERDLYF
ncbi:MAG: [FeFe] hydrogenase H-cluster radical SAM maturase HydG [Nanoarchaeota archaeon]|nr:[FeFe] hydrogenase H-cluster radical SAM maturase HydG [Nanoarchaeota archaeon]MBU2441095.1 [FeFe] hydrogenase H-cluster radical SAM maturase HydG [Nanoarchaeota archaeon]